MENIYSRVTELVEAKKQKMTMAELFQSPTYSSFIKRKADNIISGTFYMLRKEGFVASRQMEDRLLASLTIQLIHEPPQKGKEEITAYAADSGQFGHPERNDHSVKGHNSKRDRQRLLSVSFLHIFILNQAVYQRPAAYLESCGIFAELFLRDLSAYRISLLSRRLAHTGKGPLEKYRFFRKSAQESLRWSSLNLYLLRIAE